MVAELAAAGAPVTGARLRITGDLPRGSGLSSSAAMEAALALALLGVAGADEPDRVELARLCSRVENDWVGAETGLLDQLASLCGQAGHALRIDFATTAVEAVPLDLGDWRLVTLESGAEHTHAESGYNERRAECRAACDALGIEVLSQAGAEAAAALPAPLDRRARHVLSENARVDAMVAALGAGDLAAAGALLDASHASLRDDYAASVPAVEDAVAALKRAGAAGARMVGGGFGGSVLALLPPAPGYSPGRPRSFRGVRRVVCDPPRAAASGPVGACAPGTVRSSSGGPSSPSSSESGRKNCHARNRRPTSSIATPTHRLRFQPAALSISASEAPMPRTIRMTP